MLIFIFCSCGSTTNNDFSSAPGYVEEVQNGDPGVNIPLAAQNAKFARIQVDGYNLYFSTDGHQPTTQQAAEWSQANTQNEAITNWYVEMFGGPRKNGHAALEMGFEPGDNDNQTQPSKIITLDQTNMLDKNLPQARLYKNGPNVTREEVFWDTFRQIASNSIGRVLLYRLLIEIRRESPSTEKTFLVRNAARNLLVQYDTTFSFDSNLVIMTFATNYDFLVPVLKEDNGALQAEPQTRPLCVAMFHELLHWFHYLLSPCRYIQEMSTDITDHFVTRLYLGETNQANYETYTSVWKDSDNDPLFGEELRVILGNSNQLTSKGNNVFLPTQFDGKVLIRSSDFFEYLEGDDLSENSFRLSLSLPIRWGHTANVKIGTVPCDLKSVPRFMFAKFVANSCCENIKSKQWSCSIS